MDLEGVVNNEKLIIVPVETRGYLKKSSIYAKWISIIGFIFCGLGVLGSIGLIFGGASVGRFILGNGLLGLYSGRGIMLIGIILLLFMAAFIFILLKTFKFSVLTSSSIVNENNQELELGLKELKSYFTFSGILAIVCAVLFFVTMVFAMFVMAGI